MAPENSPGNPSRWWRGQDARYNLIGNMRNRPNGGIEYRLKGHPSWNNGRYSNTDQSPEVITKITTSGQEKRSNERIRIPTVAPARVET